MKKIIASSIVLFSPLTAVFAQAAVTATPGSVSNVSNLATLLTNYFNLAVQLMLAAAVVFVIWNGFKFSSAGGDEEKRKEGQNGIIYGVIGIAVMLSVWGLIALLTGSTGLGTTQTVTAPIIP